MRLQTLYSGISAGTELAACRDTNPYLLERWDAERRLFVDDPEHQFARALTSRAGPGHRPRRVVDPGVGSAAEQIKDLTGGRGADVCLEASGSTRALNEAIHACAYNAPVVVLGFYQGQAQGLFVGEESHHNRITLLSSQIGGLAPELQHRFAQADLAGAP